MATKLDSSWFTEVVKEYGSAFSLKLKEGRLHFEETPYQTVEIYDTAHFGKLMVIDGLIMLSSFDNFFYHEMMSHPALYTHANPKNIIIIGGGDCGTLQEVLKHQQVENVMQIEIDMRVTQLAEEYFPELCQGNHDPRAKFHFEDGIIWMANAPSESIDVILVDSSDPVGPAEGLFNEAFFQNCHRVLRNEGILALQSESPLYHAPLIQSIHETLRKVGFAHTHLFPFPQPVYPSGWWSATLARKNAGLTSFREQATKNQRFTTRYYNAGIHQAALVGTPEFLRNQIKQG